MTLVKNKAIKNQMVGVGLRPEHYSHLEQSPITKVDFFEALTENHMNSHGRPYKILEKIRNDYPLNFHGVGLNIAHYGKLNLDYLKKVKELITPFEPMVVSDHLCWTGSSTQNLHNLLPFPYNIESLELLCERVDQVQSFMKRELVLENLSAYFDYTQSTMKEWEFLNELCSRTGCKILLDINNIYVNSKNQDFDGLTYLNSISPSDVAEVHLAGFTDMGDFLFDTHSMPVHAEVWNLYSAVIKKLPHAPTLIEWDDDIPSFEVLENEAVKAREVIGSQN